MTANKIQRKRNWKI